MAGKISDLFVNIGAKTDDFKKGVRETENEASGLSKTFSKIGGVIAGAFAVSTIVSFGKECVQLANIAEGVEAAFKRIGDESTLEGLRKATKGTVSDLELMKAAVQANNFGIPLKNLGSLLEFAHQRAKDTGQSVEYLVQSIVLGIGRKSPLILDNLGISAVQLREKFNGLGAEQKSVADVAKAVGEIAADAMKKVGESAETSAERTARARATMEEWKLSIGKTLQSLTDLFAKAIAGIDGFLTSLAKLTANENLSFFQKLNLVFEKLTGQGFKADAINEFNEALKNTANIQAADIYEGFVKQIKATGDLDKATALISETYYSLIRQYGEMEALKKKNGKFTNDEYVAYLKIQKLLVDVTKLKKGSDDSVFKMIFGDPATSDSAKMSGLLEAAKAKVESLKKQIEQAPTTTFAAKLTNDLIQAETELTKLQQQIRSEAFGDPVGQGLKPMQGKTTTSVGSANLTPAFDENKMSSIANGYKSGAADIEQTNIDLSNSMSDVATTFADAVGQMAVGAMSMEDFGKTVAQAMIGFIKTLGEQMIAVGMAGIALEMSIENPYLALAAGLALVALAGAASATLKSGPGGSSGGGGYSTNSSAYNNSGGGLTVEIEGVVKGSDIYFTQKNYNKTLNSTVSRG
jgi:hypothetical protein